MQQPFERARPRQTGPYAADHLAGRSTSSAGERVEDSARGRSKNLFPSPFGCGVEAEEEAAEAPTSDAWVSSARRSAKRRYGTREAAGGAVALRGVESVAGGREGGGLGPQQERGGAEQGSRTVSPQRGGGGSHAKLDLLLHEVKRLNGRLDVIVDRLGELEDEKKDEMRRGRDTIS